VVTSAVQRATFESKLATSEMIARQSHQDFGTVFEDMNAFLNENPQLIQRAAADAHPWEFAYRTYKNHQRMQELQAVDVSDLEAKLREQIKAELTAQQPEPKPTPSIPDTLADQQSARGSTEALHVPTLDQILKR